MSTSPIANIIHAHARVPAYMYKYPQVPSFAQGPKTLATGTKKKRITLHV